MKGMNFIFLVFFCYIVTSISSPNNGRESKFQLVKDIENNNDFLVLTSLIENGQIGEARGKAYVQHQELLTVKSYAGHFTVNKTHNSNLFFWYFPAVNNPQYAPVILWLNGGPGASSMIGLFSENGPFIVTKNYTVKMRKYSWHIDHHLIYVDSPVGTGYSFTKNKLGYAFNEDDVGRDLLQAVVQFFNLFPELRQNDFYVTGESYCGKYVPAVSYAIKNYNKDASVKVNLKGLAIGNGLIDAFYQFYYSEYLYQIGLIDFHGRDKIRKIEEKMRDLIKQEKFVEAVLASDQILLSMFSNETSLVKNMTGFEDYQNFLMSGGYEPPYYEKFLQRSDIRKALHVGTIPYNRISVKVRYYLMADIAQSMTPVLVDLLGHYKILLYHGQLDLIIPRVGTENLILNANWHGVEEYKRAPRHQWWIDGDLAGYWKVAGNLTDVLVRNAGHLVPTDQPFWALVLLKKFTRGESL